MKQQPKLDHDGWDAPATIVLDGVSYEVPAIVASLLQVTSEERDHYKTLWETRDLHKSN